ncbi:MAG TPA: DsbC family protein [Gallionella sp.]|nr:DsbC family protein [Gallionella sp.]
MHAGEQEIRQSIGINAPQVKIDSISRLGNTGLYQVVTNGINIFYTDDKGELGFFGNVVDFKNGANLTQQEKDRLTKVDVAKLPLDKAIVRVRGNGARKLYLFSDPECPYSQQMEKELQAVSDVTIYTFLFPLAELHPDAERKARLIWCARDKTQAWDDMLLRQQEPAANDAPCATPLKDVAELASKLWIKGTPGVIFENGKLVIGAIPRRQIETLLNAAVPKQ